MPNSDECRFSFSFRWLGLIVTFSLAAGGLPGCATTPIDTQGPTSASWYATAIERHKPLGTIAGKLRPMDDPASHQSQFDDVITYARNRQSYALLIWHDGNFVLEHYFAPYQPDLRPESASMHKTVLGLLVAAAIADGYITSPDQRIGDHITAWAQDQRGNITVKQLLTMSSGLRPLSREGGVESAAVKFLFNGAEARQTLLNLELEHPPGTVFHYQDTVAQLLLLVLEAATGRAYETYLSQRLWQRMGADNAYVWLNEATGFPRGATALLARARDWLRVGLVLKDRGRFGDDEIVPSELVDSATAASSTNPNYGWLVWRGENYENRRYYNDGKTGGSFVASAPYKIDDLLYLDGFGGQRVYVSRKKDLVIVRLGAMHFDWDDAILPNLVLDALE